jgi:glycosyltransferase involved in cell wall biosynthesis
MMRESEQHSSDATPVSVIIPAYNMGEYIGAAIESVLQGTLDDVEVIVIDDGSTDSTQSVVANYCDPSSASYDPRVHYEYQSNHGKSSAVNRGLDIACGSYVTMLDADDQLTEEGLKARYEARFGKDGESSDLIIGGFEVFDHQRIYGERKPPVADDPEWLHNRFYLHWKTPFHLNACLVSRDLLNKVGRLDETIHRCIDGDYALRLLQKAETIQVIDRIVYRYRKHRSSLLERVKYRLRTARYRPRVVWKNYGGWRRYAAVPFGLALDAGKLAYELVDSYKE